MSLSCGSGWPVGRLIPGPEPVTTVARTVADGPTATIRPVATLIPAATERCPRGEPARAVAKRLLPGPEPVTTEWVQVRSDDWVDEQQQLLMQTIRYERDEYGSAARHTNSGTWIRTPDSGSTPHLPGGLVRRAPHSLAVLVCSRAQGLGGASLDGPLGDETHQLRTDLIGAVDCKWFARKPRQPGRRRRRRRAID